MSVMSIGLHDVPKDRAISDWHHRFGAIFCFFAEARPFSAAQYNNFHLVKTELMRLINLLLQQFSKLKYCGISCSSVPRYFSGSVAWQGEFLGDEVEHDVHELHRLEPTSLALHR